LKNLKFPHLKRKKKGKTKNEILHLSRVASIGCIVCGNAACVHHIRHGVGMALRSSHFDTIPLCYFHHQGKGGIHTIGRRTWEQKNGTEEELLQKVRHLLGEIS
jgi:hypothetical protein